MRLLSNYIFGSFKGLNRIKNKDFIKIIENDKFILFLVFDGVSSSDNALDAIHTTIEFITNEINSKYLEKIQLENLLFEANRHLIDAKIENGFSTYAAVYFDKNNINNSYSVSSLGDTRVYLVKQQFFTQLTKDDKLISSLNIVTKYLGMLEYSNSDFSPTEYKLEDYTKLLICSDGFSKFIEDKPLKVHKILNFKRIKNIKKSLDKLISGNNQDDASYIFINIKYV